MSLLALPPDMVRMVMQRLNTRSLLMAACSCTALRRVAGELALAPVMTSQVRMLEWLLLSHVAPRVTSLTSRCSMWGGCGFVCWLTGLRALTVTFGRVWAPIFRHLPTTLRHLDLHRLDCDEGDVFNTRRLAGLRNLETLKLTFTSHWDLVVVDGLGGLPLRHLSLRLAPTLVVRGPLRAETVHLHGVTGLICPYEVEARDLRLESTEGVVSYDLMITPRTAAVVRRLHLSCPGRITVPCMRHMALLEHLHLKYDTVLIPLRHLAAMQFLESVTFETRYGVAVAGMLTQLPRHVRAAASVGGVPLSAAALESMFYA